MIRAAERWRSIRVTDFERRQMEVVRQEIDHAYEARHDLAPQPSADAHQTPNQIIQQYSEVTSPAVV